LLGTKTEDTVKTARGVWKSGCEAMMEHLAEWFSEDERENFINTIKAELNNQAYHFSSKIYRDLTDDTNCSYVVFARKATPLGDLVEPASEVSNTSKREREISSDNDEMGKSEKRSCL
jgi:hypothetical protein